MKINFTNLFNSTVDSIVINHNVDLSNFIYSTYNPIKDGVKVVGSAYSKADVVYLDINISFSFHGYCDRCADNVTKNYSFDLKRIIVDELQNEDNDDYIVITNKELDLDELVSEEVSLFIPSKILCSDDCKGLCYQCGANLNVKKCDCKKDIDPRMEALLQLLEEE